MSQLQKLKDTVTLHDLAELLGFKPKALSYIVFKKTNEVKYSHFEIPKKNGGVRKISAPCSDLSKLQQRVSQLLQDCIAEINDSKKINSKLSHGFQRKKSIMSNADVHKRKRFVLNIDLENFFGTINFGRVRGFFIKNKNFELHEKVATILAQIICFENSLPQGSPSSPVTSNLIGHILDIHLANLAKKNGCDYSRYADDITFSTNKRSFPKSIATLIDNEKFVWQPGDELHNIIDQAKFKINSLKTRMQYKDSRQDVTGLVVNKKINTRTECRRTARAMVHNLITTGSYYLPNSAKDETILDTEKIIGTKEHLNGVLGFIHMVSLYKKEKNSLNPFKLDLTTKSYQKFKLFNDFYSSSTPVIICEGKTDNIYIRSAIQQLATQYPDLAIKETGSVKVRLKHKIYNYTNTTGDLLGLSGGSGDLCNFIRIYKSVCHKFKAVGYTHPIIIIADNDKGAKGKNGIYSFLKDAPSGDADGLAPFYNIFKNLYVILTPIEKGGESMIEDLFDKSTKEIKLGNKTFNPHNGFDSMTQFGKYLFATQIIKKQQNLINFKGFIPILDRVVKILSQHYQAEPFAKI